MEPESRPTIPKGRCERLSSEKKNCEDIAVFIRSLEGKMIPYNVIKKLQLVEKELESCGVIVWPEKEGVK